jgi:prolyl-tRNA synthetase
MKEKKSEEGLTAKKREDFSEWFQQLIAKSGLADYSSVSGAIVLRPRSYAIWEKVQSVIDREFKAIGIRNAYFPLLIPEKLLSREKEHVKGFTPEVAWVTQAGDTKLSERLAIRPTSESIMYDSYSKWIRSHRDLPLRLNQWNNVVRWEFKHPVPFLRTREFLWNEGHHAYSNHEELEEDRKRIMGIYSGFLRDYMALPCLYGKKTDSERFAGAVATYSLELVLPNGKAIQGPDYHDDGQNFAKAYDIKFIDNEGKEKYCHQSTYAITTRMLGIMFAVHSDDKGLVLPPKMAENKAVIVPIIFEDSREKVLKKAREIEKSLEKYGAFADLREDISTGRKFNEWELKGIPIRIEIGPKDIEKGQAVVKTRLGKKHEIKFKDLSGKIAKLLDEMQDELYGMAEKSMNEMISVSERLADLTKSINGGKIALVPICESEKCEDSIREKTQGAKALNIPEEQPKVSGKKCIFCGKNASFWAYVGKSY